MMGKMKGERKKERRGGKKERGKKEKEKRKKSSTAGLEPATFHSTANCLELGRIASST